MANDGEFRTSGTAREGFIEGHTFGRRRVRYAEIDGKAIFEGDIVIRPLPDGAPAVVGAEPQAVIISGKSHRWPGGVVPFEIDGALGNVARVHDAIAHWHSVTGMLFLPRKGEANFVAFVPGNGCSSPVGMDGGRQGITLGDGCSKGSAIHEIGHSVGLWHEQSREDRNEHVKVHLENVESGKEHNFNQHISDGDDVGPYDFGSIMHYSALAFSKNDKPTIETLHGESIGQRNGLSASDIGAVNHMYFPVTPMTVGNGVHTFRQKSSMRYVDAHEHSGKDFGVVTRPAQSNATQKWIVRPVGAIYTVRQKSNARFLDAHEHSAEDFRAVTRENQNNDTQRWVIMFLGDGEYSIRQLSSGRMLDAHASQEKDFSVVTRPAAAGAPQTWLITAAANGGFTIRQKSTMRFLDAHEIAAKDFMLVTRPEQNDATQQWLLTPTATICTVQQLSGRRYLDAYSASDKDFAAVTREAQGDDDQRWLFTAQSQNRFTIQQWSSRRFLDAHEIEGRDFALVTRPAQNNDTQVWLVDPSTL